jgi:colanic acid/amylovoran biosynthesis glycosyltransferase
LDAGFDVDVFPFYPADPGLWRYLPDELDENVFPRRKVHDISFSTGIASLRPWPIRRAGLFLRDTSAIALSASRFGVRPLAKSAYVFPKAWAWSKMYRNCYDHVFAYWGNYAATCAYIFHRLTNSSAPLSMWLHASIDLYQDQVYLREKVLYADNIFLGCEFNRRFLRGLYPDIFDEIAPKIVMHHTSIDLRRYTYQPDERLPHRVVAVGGLEKYKGFRYLIEAVHELTRRGVDVELELVGDGTEARPLKALAEKLSVADRVVFAGWLNTSEVRAEMARATLLVHPSTGIGDAVPTVIKEAMALGTPVVGSDLAGIPELLDGGRCGIVVPPADPPRIADAIQRLLQDGALRQRYAQAARRYAEENFDIHRNGPRLARILSATERRER